jgi:hypothetical protein
LIRLAGSDALWYDFAEIPIWQRRFGLKDKKLQDEIARVAYELYEKRGGSHGCDFDDWVEAERIVAARHAAGKSGKATAGVKRKAAATKGGGASPAGAGSSTASKKPVRKKTGKS